MLCIFAYNVTDGCWLYLTGRTRLCNLFTHNTTSYDNGLHMLNSRLLDTSHSLANGMGSVTTDDNPPAIHDIKLNFRIMKRVEISKYFKRPRTIKYTLFYVYIALGTFILTPIFFNLKLSFCNFF